MRVLQFQQRRAQIGKDLRSTVTVGVLEDDAVVVGKDQIATMTTLHVAPLHTELPLAAFERLDMRQQCLDAVQHTFNLLGIVAQQSHGHDLLPGIAEVFVGGVQVEGASALSSAAVEAKESRMLDMSSTAQLVGPPVRA